MVKKENVLNKFFKPFFASFTKDKWQSRNPDVRKKAVQELPVSEQETLNNIAMNDSEESIRAIAANKLSDLDLLQTIIMKGTNGTVKEAAQNRLFQLISGLKHPIPDYDVREKMIRGSRNSALLEFVAANANEASLREITIKKVSRDPLLGNIALSDDSPHIRQLAAQQIAKRSTLERVTKQSRRKDKRVYKIVKTKLDHIIEDEARPALLAKEVVEICNKLDKLQKRNLLLQEKSTFENYVARWSEIQNFADVQTTERYHNICSSIIISMDELELRLKREQDAIQTLETLLNNLSNSVDDLLNARENQVLDNAEQEAIKTSEKTILNLGREWDDVIKRLTHEGLISDYNSKFQSILNLADEKTIFENKTDDDSLKIIQSLAEQCENMLSKPGVIFEKSISAIQNKFQQQIDSLYQTSDSEHSGQSEELVQFRTRFNTAIVTLKEQLSIQQKKAEKFNEKIITKTDKIKSLIEEGLVSQAEKLLKEELKLIDKSDLISNIEKSKHQNSLQKIHSQLGDLSAWRNWAHDHERENLTIKAEQLAEQINNSNNFENEYTDITSQVKEFRKQWKSMHSHTQEEIWQRFNTACNHAYEQCKPYIDKQNEQRLDNLKTKQALCEQLEHYIKTMQWPSNEEPDVNQSIDWIQVDKITRQARKEWSSIGFVDRKHHRSVNTRFDKSIEIIRDELKKVWQVNQDKFYDLIHKVEALEDIVEDNLNDAINSAKAYQSDWKKIGPVSSYQRNKLWKKFRGACDIIFNKRQENIEQKNKVNTEKLREKEAICENLEALNQQPLNKKDLENAFFDIKNLWLELGSQSRSLSKEVNNRYALALEVYQEKIKKLDIELEKQLLDQITQEAELCTEVEASTNTSEEAISEFNQHWQALNKDKVNKFQLSKRFNNSLKSMVTDKSTQIQTEIAAKQHFCLKYEILLAKETPAEFQQSRMEMQVDLLNSNLGSNRSDDSNTSIITDLELQLEWYSLNNYSRDADLEDRFKQLLSN